jgi:hypothetical protein
VSDATSRTAEEWGRVAVSLPGWEWMPGMRAAGPAGPRGGRKRAIVTGTLSEAGAPRVVDFHGRRVPAWFPIGCPEQDVSIDPDDPATAGCLMRLLGRNVVAAIGPNGARVGVDGVGADGLPCNVYGKLERTLGRACIAAAEAVGRWPGGEG